MRNTERREMSGTYFERGVWAKLSTIKQIIAKNAAPKEPAGMAILGFLRSPDMFVPDMMPVTPANRMPKTMMKL